MNKFDKALQYFIEYESHNRLNGAQIAKGCKTIKESYLSDMDALAEYMLNRKRDKVNQLIEYRFKDKKEREKTVDAILELSIENKEQLTKSITNLFEDAHVIINDHTIATIDTVTSLICHKTITILYPTYQIDNKNYYLNCFKCRIEGQDLMIDEFRVNQSFLDKLYLKKFGYGLDEVLDGPTERSIYFDGLQDLELTSFKESQDIMTSKLKGKFHEVAEFLEKNSTENALATLDELGDLYFPPFKDDMLMVLKSSERDKSSLLRKYILHNETAKDVTEIVKRSHLGSYTSAYPINNKQWSVVSAAKQSEMVTVSGPPGTGKTTLLKEIIAEAYISKTKRLIDHWNVPWEKTYDEKTAVFSTPFLNENLDSVVVTSANNEAVNNIGVEASSDIAILKKKLGLILEIDFSAQLGKKDNRVEFKTKNMEVLLNVLSDKYPAIDASKEVEEFNGITEKIELLNASVQEYLELFSKYHTEGILRYDTNCSYFSYTQMRNSVDAFSERISEKEKTISEESDKIKSLRSRVEDAREERQRLSKNLNRLTDTLFNKQEELNQVKERYNGLFAKLLGVIPKGDVLKRTLYGDDQTLVDAIEKLENEIKPLEIKIEMGNEGIKEQRRKEDSLQKIIDDYKVELERLKQDKKSYKNFIELFDVLSCDIDGVELATYNNEYKLFNAPVFLQWRHRLFELSLIIQERYILKNSVAIRNNLSNFLTSEGKVLKSYYRSSFKYKERELNDLRAIWATFCLCFPVITTTLHSFGRNNFHFIDKLFDYILVDEAGQILPYYLVGPFYRARRAIIVGDEKQLEPIRDQHNNVFNKYEDDLSSTLNINESTAQGLSVLAADYFEEDNSGGQFVKQGILLEEHRRCQNSIVQFSNKYVYDSKMIIVNKDESTRYIGRNLSFVDIRGMKENNSNESEVQAIKHIVDELLQDYEAKDIAVIAPYTNQVKRLEGAIKNKEIGIGTVHSFQGKDKEAVVFSMVIDSVEDKRAKRFIGEKPNMLNVAFTRAKQQMIIVGNYEITRECEPSNYIYKAGKFVDEFGVVLSVYDTDKLEKMNDKEYEAYTTLIRKMSTNEFTENSMFDSYLNKAGMIEDDKHYPLLLNLFKNANQSIEVISPWISKAVVNDEFIESIIKFRRDNKRYGIVFGYNKTSYNLNTDKDISEIVRRDNIFPIDNEEEVKRIKKLKSILGNELVYRPPLHTKALIVDRKYLCIGSHNWLAKQGQRKNAREEMTVIVSDQGMIDYMCKKHGLK